MTECLDEKSPPPLDVEDNNGGSARSHDPSGPSCETSTTCAAVDSSDRVQCSKEDDVYLSGEVMCDHTEGVSEQETEGESAVQTPGIAVASSGVETASKKTPDLLVPCTPAAGGGIVTQNGGSSASWLDGSDSCPSVSPSPGPDGGESFVFSDVAALDGATEELSAALQAEKEFLDFMCSLPQVQESNARMGDVMDAHPVREEVSSLDHLGHLCRVVEQLAELKEQNVRLQRRVQYLEDLRLLHQMHRQMTETLATERSLEEEHQDGRCRTASQDNSRRAQGVPQDSLDALLPRPVPQTTTRGTPPLRPSLPATSQPPPPTSRGGGQRRGTMGDTALMVGEPKEKKGHRSAWGKVKHIIINTRKDNKKASPSRLSHSKSALCTSPPPSSEYVPYSNDASVQGAAIAAQGVSGSAAVLHRGPDSREDSVASSDPEDYDMEALNLLNDPIWDVIDPDGDLAGIWMGPKDAREPKEEMISALSPNFATGTGWPYSISTSTYSSANTSPTGIPLQFNVSPLLLSSASPSTTSSISPTTPPSSSTTSQGLSSGLPIPPLSSYIPHPANIPKVSVSAPGSFENAPEFPSSSPPTHRLTDHQHPSHRHHSRDGRFKPHLTITVPSTEDLRNIKMGHQDSKEDLFHQKDDHGNISEHQHGRKHHKHSQHQHEHPTMHHQQHISSDQQDSNWTKVKHAFLTPNAAVAGGRPPPSDSEDSGHPTKKVKGERRSTKKEGGVLQDDKSEGESCGGSLPPSPNRKASFLFEDESEQPSRGTPELLSPHSPSTPSSRHPSGGSRNTPSPITGLAGGVTTRDASSTGMGSLLGASPPGPAHGIMAAGGAVGRNLADLQKALSGEFNKKIHEWEKLKGQQWLYGAVPGTGRGSAGPAPSPLQMPEGNLPHDFKKKLHEWEKIKEKERFHGGGGGLSSAFTSGGHSPSAAPNVQGPLSLASQDSGGNKARRRTGAVVGEADSLPPEFRKRLTEWEIGKVLAGKSRQNVQELQKSLGEEFNRKMAEWERMKAAADSLTSGGAADPPAASGSFMGGLDRKGSAHKVKKIKGKIEKQTPGKNEGPPKSRGGGKEVQWLERELNKIEREKLRLEREKEKYMERQARLESMWNAYNQGKVHKKEVLIKTSTGEFRFEGISQTFTKRLYEWEERRGIRPESSTIALLAPHCQDTDGAPNTRGGGQDSPRSPDIGRLPRFRCKSESSVADLAACNGGAPSLPSTLSLTERTEAIEDQGSLGDYKASSEPTLGAEDGSLSVSCTAKFCSALSALQESSDLILPANSTSSAAEIKAKIIYPDEETSQQLLDPSVATLSADEVEDSWTTSQNISDFEDKPESQAATGDEEATTSALETDLAPIAVGVASKMRRKGSVSRQSSARSLGSLKATYAPAEITRLIDSSDSDEDSQRRRRTTADIEYGLPGALLVRPPRGLRTSESLRSEASYQDLLHENMSLLEQLRTQEVVCRALQTQMGDIDNKMDSVTDQHIKTLEKLHEQVTIMKDSVAATDTPDELVDSESLEVEKSMKTSAETLSESNVSSYDNFTSGASDLPKSEEQFTVPSNGEIDEISRKDSVIDILEFQDLPDDKISRKESRELSIQPEEFQTKKDLENQLLIAQLRERIVELELHGESLLRDKEKLEASFQHHKERETHLAESLLLRMRDLREAQADWHSSSSLADLPLDHQDDVGLGLAGEDVAQELSDKVVAKGLAIEDVDKGLVRSGDTSNIPEDVARVDVVESPSQMCVSDATMLPPHPAAETLTEQSDDSPALTKRNKAFKRQNRIHDDELTSSKPDASLLLDQQAIPNQNKLPKIVGVELKPTFSDDANRDQINEPGLNECKLQDVSATKKLKTSIESSQKIERKHDSERSIIAECSVTNGDSRERKISSTLERRQDESESIRSVRKRSKESHGQGNSERKTSSRREKSKSSSAGEKRRRSRPEQDDSADEEEESREGSRAARRRKKTPTKKVMRLHSLTADLLFQAKRLEQALVSRQMVANEEAGRLGALEGADADRRGGLGDCHRGLRGRSSLRLAGEALPRHTPRHAPRIPGQTRTWSSIETIAAPSEMLGAGSPLTPGEVLRNKRNPSESGSQPDLLALNADISRMAKELRLQMMDLWTFRESTSPESVASEQDDGRPFSKVPSFEEKSEARRKLFQEAQEVFHSIASLQRSSQDTSSPTSPQAPSSPVPSPLSFIDPTQIHSPPHSPQSEIPLRHTLFMDSLSDRPSKGFPSLSPPSLSKSRRSDLLKGSSMRPSLTSPSLVAYSAGKGNIAIVPQREAWSLDLEDDPVAKDERLTRLVNEPPAGARAARKGGSIEEEHDNVLEEDRTEVSQSFSKKGSCTNSPDLLLNDENQCEFFLEYNNLHSQGDYEARNPGRMEDPRELPTALDKLEIIEANEEDIPVTNASSAHNLAELEHLLPKGPNTTFADLIRVHDQLHKYEMEKQYDEVELATKRKLADTRRDPSKPQRDHLQEAFHTCQSEESFRHQEELQQNQPPEQQQQPQPYYKYNYLSDTETEIVVPSTNEKHAADQYQTDYENYQSSLRDARQPPEFVHREGHGYLDPSHLGSKQEESREDESTIVSYLPQGKQMEGYGRSSVTSSLQQPRKHHEASPTTEIFAGSQEVDLTSFATATMESGMTCKHKELARVSEPFVTQSSLAFERSLQLSNLPEQDSMDRVSQFGTWKSFDHVLSSSFEWELDENPISGNETYRGPACLATAGPSTHYTQTINQAIGHDQAPRKKNVNIESPQMRSPETSELHEERSQFETEVTPEHIQTSLGRLRTRRVSDTQVEYHESSGRKVHRKASSRQATNVIVPTKRTIFTPTSNAHATPNFLQSVGEDILSAAEVRKNSKPMTEPCSEDSAERFKRSREDVQVKQDAKDYADSKMSSSSNEIIENGDDSHFFWRGASMPGFISQAGAVSPPVESKRKVLEAANRTSGETSPTVRGMIESYNKRITERQSLLTSSFKYWMSDNSSSNNTNKSTAPLHLTIPSSPVFVIKSSSASVMPASAVSPDLLRGIQKSASGPTWNSASRASPMLSTPLDTSLDTSVDEVQQLGARAFKIKKAKEEFFSRGNPARRESKKRYSNESANTASYDSLNISMATTPSPQPIIVVSPDVDMIDKPPIQGPRRHSGTHKKDSVRRESAGAVLKSASSGVVQYRQPHPIRPSSTEPVLHSGRSPKGIFRLFRRSKEKDRKDLSAIQKLCRHSLEVDIEKIDGKEEKRPSTSSLEVVGVSGRSSSTLPRHNDAAGEGPSTRSCPSSPVAQPRTRASRWLTRGKELLKGRSPSPNICKQTR